MDPAGDLVTLGLGPSPSDLRRTSATVVVQGEQSARSVYVCLCVQTSN